MHPQRGRNELRTHANETHHRRRLYDRRGDARRFTCIRASAGSEGRTSQPAPALESRAGQQGNAAREASPPDGGQTSQRLDARAPRGSQAANRCVQYVDPSRPACRSEGTAKRTSAQIANEVDSLGASLDATSRFGASFTSVTASGLINTAPQVLDLMSDVVLNPAFSDDELGKYKQTEGANLEQRLSNPAFLATQAFKKTVYGDTPMAIASATKESIEKISSADLKKFHDAHYLPGNTILGITGDFKTTEMEALVAKYFGAWKGAAEPAMKFPDSVAPQPSKILLVDRPGSVQTFIIAGDRTIRRTDPEYYALDVMNQVLGGGPQARLFLDLREEHSLTYGSYSRFTADVYPGDWQASAPVRTPVTKESMDRFIYEFKKINNEPTPQAELDDAHRAIVAGFALSLEQPREMISDWLTVQYYGLPVDYWDKYPDQIFAVGIPGVQAAAKKYVDLDKLQWVCVGDRKAIEADLKQYGPVTVVDVKGNPEN
jgi:zinc protease